MRRIRDQPPADVRRRVHRRAELRSGWRRSNGRPAADGWVPSCRASLRPAASVPGSPTDPPSWTPAPSFDSALESGVDILSEQHEMDVRNLSRGRPYGADGDPGRILPWPAVDSRGYGRERDRIDTQLVRHAQRLSIAGYELVRAVYGGRVD